MCSGFRRYMHVERIASDECEGLLEQSEVWVSPKLDGTNASAWWDDDAGWVGAGSRNRGLTLESDNAGFAAWLNGASEQARRIRSFLSEHRLLRLYGEFGVGKVGRIKDYEDGARDVLWVFDVYDTVCEHYLSYDEWMPLMLEYGISFIPHTKFVGSTVEELEELAERTVFLIAGGCHSGEGLVVKAYDWRNKWGNFQYGKLVLEEYKQKGKLSKKKQCEDAYGVEELMVELFVTDAELGKTLAKVEAAEGKSRKEFESSQIARFLQSAYHDALLEEWPSVIKKFKRCKVDFAVLQSLCYAKAREYIGL